MAIILYEFSRYWIYYIYLLSAKTSYGINATLNLSPLLFTNDAPKCLCLSLGGVYRILDAKLLMGYR